LVAPVGTDYVQVAENLASQLTEFGYKSNTIKLSSQIGVLSNLMGVPCELKEHPEFERIESHMKAANKLYAKFNEIADDDEKTSLLALVGVNEIANIRAKGPTKRALLNQAHILLTLKRPEEINCLRRIYGIGLNVIGVFATEEERIKHLVRRKGVSDEEARTLINDDENDNLGSGQRTGDSFHLADVFVDVGTGTDDWKRQLGRFLDLLFSDPYKTPTKDEQAMFMAHSASLRSAQLGRQVGAAIATDEGDIVSIGCNEVPKAFGGQYWDNDPFDERDHRKGIDSNDEEKNKILDEIMGVLPEEYKTSAEVPASIRKTSLFSITEFGRASHAEMEAILSWFQKRYISGWKNSLHDNIPLPQLCPAHRRRRY
jgi:deoxycytidylate deaminase